MRVPIRQEADTRREFFASFATMSEGSPRQSGPHLPPVDGTPPQGRTKETRNDGPPPPAPGDVSDLVIRQVRIRLPTSDLRLPTSVFQPPSFDFPGEVRCIGESLTIGERVR